MARYYELAAFAQFGSDLDETTRRQLDRGRRLTEILKQPQYRAMPLEEQVIVIYAGTEGYASQVPVEQMEEYERNLLHYMRTKHAEIGESISRKKALTEDIEQALQAALESFNVQWSKA
jgi:F-type H+-transporting ATPase subunit alpha